MLYFENDYCEGAHPAILQKLTEFATFARSIQLRATLLLVRVIITLKPLF